MCNKWEEGMRFESLRGKLRRGVCDRQAQWRFIRESLRRTQ